MIEATLLLEVLGCGDTITRVRLPMRVREGGSSAVRLGAGGRQSPIDLGPCRATRTKLSALRLHRHQESVVVRYWPGVRWRCPRIGTRIESPPF